MYHSGAVPQQDRRPLLKNILNDVYGLEQENHISIGRLLTHKNKIMVMHIWLKEKSTKG